MHRFFHEILPDRLDPGATVDVALDADQAAHAGRVLRLTSGDAVELFNGRGIRARGAVIESRPRLRVRIDFVRQIPPPRPMITIAVTLPKGGRADDMVNQLAQVGADRIVPLRTQRSVVDPRDTKRDRLDRIAVQAARQSHRAHLPLVASIMNLSDALEAPAQVRLWATLDAGPNDGLAPALREAGEVTVFVGPEGGWTDEECAMARRAGAIPWKIGPHVMRIETAAVTAVALVRYLTLEAERTEETAT